MKKTIITILLISVMLLVACGTDVIDTDALRSLWNGAERTTETSQLSMREEAYRFLEESVNMLIDGDYRGYTERCSRQVLDHNGMSAVGLESVLRTRWTNLKIRNVKIQGRVKSETKAFWGVVCGYYATVNGEPQYAEDTLIAFREDGKWVIAAEQDLPEDLVTEPESMSEVDGYEILQTEDPA